VLFQYHFLSFSALCGLYKYHILFQENKDHPPKIKGHAAGLPEPLAPSVCLDAFWFLTPALKFYP